MRYFVVLMVVVGFVGCEGPVEPMFIDEEVIADVDPSLPETGLIAFNDVGQVLWSEDRQTYLWDGSEVQTIPFEGIDLGPNGAIVGVEGPFFYWKDGETTEIPPAYGFDGQGRVYVRIGDDWRWWTPEGTSPAPLGVAGWSKRIRAVGDDGSIFYSIWHSDPRREYVYYHSNLEEEVEVERTAGSYSRHDITDSGLLYLVGGETTKVIDTRDWSEQTFEFGAYDMNDQMIFVTGEGEIVNDTGEILGTVEAVDAFINDQNEILSMTPDGTIKILR